MASWWWTSQLADPGRAALLAVIPPETGWQSLPSGLNGEIFTGGGPAEWQGPGRGFSVIQVARNSRDGLPVRAVLAALSGAPLYRPDRLGSVERVEAGLRFMPAH